MSNDKGIKVPTSKNVEIKLDILNNEELQTELKTLKDVLAASYGPTGRSSFIQHASGGHVTVTSRSSQILKTITTVSTPLTRLLLQSVQGHTNHFNDGGLFTALLTIQVNTKLTTAVKMNEKQIRARKMGIKPFYHADLKSVNVEMRLLGQKLIESSLKCGLPRHTVIAINEDALGTILAQLESSHIKLSADMSNMKQMLCVIRSILATQSASGLTNTDIQSLAVLLLRGFLSCVPTSRNETTSLDNLRILECDGPSVSESCLKKGILVEAKYHPVTDTIWAEKDGIKVALFDCSLAGNVDDTWLNCGKTEMSSDFLTIEDNALTLMTRMVDDLIVRGVKLIACQKVIHPTLQHYITRKGLFVIERLSISNIEAVRRLTGSTLLSSFQGEISDDSFGMLAEIKLVVMQKKRYIHLMPHASTVPEISTLVLCAPDEHGLDELKSLCLAVLESLKQLLYQPFVVPGAGCFETIIAGLLLENSQRFDGVRELACSKQQYSGGLHMIATVFLYVARTLDHDGYNHLVDRTMFHHWVTRPLADQLTTPHHCLCGLVTSHKDTEWYMTEELCSTHMDNGIHGSLTEYAKDFENVVLDVMSMKVNGIKTAFEIANTILRVKHFVKEICE